MKRLTNIISLPFLLLSLLIVAGCEIPNTHKVSMYNSLMWKDGSSLRAALLTSDNTWTADTGEFSECEVVSDSICIHFVLLDDELVYFNAINCIFGSIDIDELCPNDAVLELGKEGSNMKLTVYCTDSCSEVTSQAYNFGTYEFSTDFIPDLNQQKYTFDCNSESTAYDYDIMESIIDYEED